MKKWIEINPGMLIGISVSVFIVFVVVILLTRIFGKRSFSKMSSFDFAMTVAVGSIIATTIISPSPNLSQGLVALLMVYLIQLIAAYLRRYKAFSNLIDNSPLLLMDGEKILKENLLKARVTEADIQSKLREANVYSLSQIKAVVFETTGDISVIHSSDNQTIDPWIMTDVNNT